MKKLLVCGLAMFMTGALAPSSGFADNIGTCGWGSKLFDGNTGPAPQILAVTTNGFLGNQTFGISSATSGCTRDGKVTSTWKQVMYIDSNMNRLAKEMAVGQGESLASLATIWGVKDSDKALFYSSTQTNFEKIFPNTELNAEEVAANLSKVMASEPRLAQYAVVG